VDGAVIIGHGRSNARAIKNAVRAAMQAVEQGMVEAIRAGVSTAGADTSPREGHGPDERPGHEGERGS